MSKTETTITKGSAPTHIVYQVTDNGKQAYWNRVGAAWTHKDGKGFSIQLESLPLDGRLSLRVAAEKL